MVNAQVFGCGWFWPEFRLWPDFLILYSEKYTSYTRKNTVLLPLFEVVLTPRFPTYRVILTSSDWAH